MFCDMEGFTQLTERLGPEEAYGIMDQVYEILIHKVHDYEGTDWNKAKSWVQNLNLDVGAGGCLLRMS